MPVSFDNALGVQQDALRFHNRRNDLLASNLANADTPNYKARDMDFREALAESGGMNVSMQATHDSHLGANPNGSGSDAEPQYRVPNQPSLDGNTVDPEQEMSAFAENVMRYEAALRFTDGRLSSMREAITGQPGV